MENENKNQNPSEMQREKMKQSYETAERIGVYGSIDMDKINIHLQGIANEIQKNLNASFTAFISVPDSTDVKMKLESVSLIGTINNAVECMLSVAINNDNKSLEMQRLFEKFGRKYAKHKLTGLMENFLNDLVNE